jgi:hypothetical protein
MKVSLFPVKYVRSLAISLIACISLSAVVITFLTVKFHEMYMENQRLERKVAEHLGLSDLYDHDRVAARIEILKEEERLSKMRGFVKKVNPKLSYVKADKIVMAQKKYSNLYGVPIEKGFTVSFTESTFRPDAVSPTGPIGLNQIASTYWSHECGVTKSQLLEIDHNVRCGYYILAKHYSETGDWGKVFERYYGGTPNENRAYRNKIEKNRKKIIGEIS